MNLGTMNDATFSSLQRQPESRVVDVQPEVADMNHFLNFETDRVQPLTMAQLKRTVRENDGKSNDPLQGIYHYKLLEELADICESQGYQAEVFDMFATNNRDKQTPGVSLYPELEARYGTRAVEAHSIRRLFTNLRIRDFDTDEVTTNLAVSYTQKGIQVGIGRNVIICHNQCMLSGKRYIATFNMKGQRFEQRLTPMELIKHVKGWIMDLRRIVNEDDQTIERMKQTTLTPAQVMLIIGMLTTIRVQNDTVIDEIRTRHPQVYPLNQSQISRFTEHLLLEQHKEGIVTAWSMYNAATDLYKPQTNEQSTILTQNLSMVDFMRTNGIF